MPGKGKGVKEGRGRRAMPPPFPPGSRKQPLPPPRARPLRKQPALTSAGASLVTVTLRVLAPLMTLGLVALKTTSVNAVQSAIVLVPWSA